MGASFARLGNTAGHGMFSFTGGTRDRAITVVTGSDRTSDFVIVTGGSRSAVTARSSLLHGSYVLERYSVTKNIKHITIAVAAVRNGLQGGASNGQVVATQT